MTTETFRRSGQVSSGRQTLFDEFWSFKNENVGFSRLDRLLDQICARLQPSANDEMRSALLADCRFNATLVGDDVFADARLFEGYQHIVPDACRCVATYIGASHWVTFAEETRRVVKQFLETAAVWPA